MGKTMLFTHVSETEDCGIVFYDGKTGSEVFRKSFSLEDRIGKTYRLKLSLDEIYGNGSSPKETKKGSSKECQLRYQFYQGEKRVPDKKGRGFFSSKKYGEIKEAKDIYTLMELPEFDWKGTKRPEIPYCDTLIYCMHVRGFTKHVSSGVKNRGTFAGVIEKIPYLKSIGVTCLEFQPIYEFLERTGANRLNYWGYTEGYYYAPKAAYAKNHPVTECKEMIRSLHEAGMEAVLQFYFPSDFNQMEIPEILRFWVEEYQVDGFSLIGENLPAELIAKDPELSDTKIWYYQMDAERIYGKRTVPKYKNLGLMKDDFLYDGRRFLKGEENLVPAMTYQLRTIYPAVAKINYLSTYWGLTLMDMVSYDFKHNEANGEDNHDGTDYNCSWNCGEEGTSRKKRIQELRLTQLKNAFCLLLLAQGTPRIFMGDEFGNSQKGNNNPYCQDNEITWLNWNNLQKNNELHEFFRKLIELRKKNPVLRPGEEAKLMDSISCGYPEMSFHGVTAWRAQLENYSRQLGILYCGLYKEENLGISRKNAPEKTKMDAENKGFDFLYWGMNMHWESHKLGLPRLPKGKVWEILLCTSEDGADPVPVQDAVMIAPRTMALYVSKDVVAEELHQETHAEESASKDHLNIDNDVTSALKQEDKHLPEENA
ncbi:MAG: alpha-amylase [Lachnospiraceae bacterium]|nr:alpha-amylase [Lachnospiraceae bacterium]